jgi:excisionase family DNA binding protein
VGGPAGRLLRHRGMDQLLKPSDLAQKLGVSRSWLYDAAKTGRIPSIRIGGEDGPLRFVAEDIDRWLQEARAAWTPGRRTPATRHATARRKRSRPSPTSTSGGSSRPPAAGRVPSSAERGKDADLERGSLAPGRSHGRLDSGAVLGGRARSQEAGASQPTQVGVV